MAYELIVQKASITIQLGSGLSATTPYVINCTVSRSRGSHSTANFTFRTDAAANNLVNNFSGEEWVYIQIGATPLFRGIIKNISIGPSFNCAGEVIVKGSAEDEMIKLQNVRMTRRQKLPALGVMAVITSVYQRPQIGYDDPMARFNVSQGGSDINIVTSTMNMAAQSQWVTGYNFTHGNEHPLTKYGKSIIQPGSSTGGSNMGLHDHSSLDTSGPHAGGSAVGVFGVK